MTAHKKGGAKTAAKGGVRLEIGMRFGAGKMTPEHAKALKDQLHRMVPEMIDRLANAPRMSSGAFSTFQRTAPPLPPPPTKRVKKTSGRQ